MEEHVLVVAGGRGSRMQKSIPKQFLKIGDFPILMHTIHVFYQYSQQINIILVLPETEINYWEGLCRKFNFIIPHKIQAGGSTRQESVQNGLMLIADEGLVAIHDGVRPFVDLKLISRGFQEAKKNGNAIASVPLKDSIRFVTSDENKSVARENFRIIQTPQTFLVSQIKAAYAKTKSSFTDDASVAESAGYKINLIEGDYNNIKITTEEDLVFAEWIIGNEKDTGRVPR